MSGFRWTSEEDAVLAQMVAEGSTFSQMAFETGASRCAVAGRVNRLGLQGPRSNPAMARHLGRNAVRAA